MARLTKFIRVKMDPTLRANIQKLAEREERSFSGQLRFILKRVLELLKNPEYAEAFGEYCVKQEEAKSRERSKVRTKKARILRLVVKETAKDA